jgi:hypothetical protein
MTRKGKPSRSRVSTQDEEGTNIVIPAKAGIWGKPSGWQLVIFRPMAGAWIPLIGLTANRVWNDKGGLRVRACPDRKKAWGSGHVKT